MEKSPFMFDPVSVSGDVEKDAISLMLLLYTMHRV